MFRKCFAISSFKLSYFFHRQKFKASFYYRISTEKLSENKFFLEFSFN